MKYCVKILFISILFQTCSGKKAETFQFSISFPKCSECKIEISTYDPFDFNPIKIDSFHLDSNGQKSRRINVEQLVKSFVSINDSIYFPIFASNQENLDVIFQGDSPGYSGSLGGLSAAIYKTEKLQVGLENSENAHIFGLDLDQFYKRLDKIDSGFRSILDSSSLSRDHRDLLSKIHMVKSLNYAFSYALMNYNFYTGKFIPEQILEIQEFPDYPELINSSVSEYGQLAEMNFDMRLYPLFWPKGNNQDSTILFFSRTDSLLKKQDFSMVVEEFLRARNLARNMKADVKRGILEQLTLRFQQDFSQSKYLNRLSLKLSKRARLEIGATAPNIIGKKANGERVELTDLKGKIVLIDIWASWCKPCIKSLPALKEIEMGFDNSEVVFLYVSVDLKEEKWRTANSEYLNDRLSIIETGETSIYSDYLVGGIPRYIILDREGEVFDPNAPSPLSGNLKQAIERSLSN